jgi:hypothetical protein
VLSAWNRINKRISGNRKKIGEGYEGRVFANNSSRYVIKVPKSLDWKILSGFVDTHKDQALIQSIIDQLRDVGVCIPRFRRSILLDRKYYQVIEKIENLVSFMPKDKLEANAMGKQLLRIEAEAYEKLFESVVLADQMGLQLDISYRQYSPTQANNIQYDPIRKEFVLLDCYMLREASECGYTAKHIALDLAQYFGDRIIDKDSTIGQIVKARILLIYSKYIISENETYLVSPHTV